MQETEVVTGIDIGKRVFVGSGLGVLSVLLAACESRNFERSSGPQAPGGASTGNPSSLQRNRVVVTTTGQDTKAGINCACGAGGGGGGGVPVPQPPGAVVNPAPGAGVGTPPVTTVPGTPAAVVGANAIQTYAALGPGTSFDLSVFDEANPLSVTMADGRQISVWGFLPTGVTGPQSFNNDRANPAPTLVVTEGSLVQLTLNSMHPHTIHLHGLDVNQANDGVPATSGFVGEGMMGNTSGYMSLGGSYTYRFVAPKAGTYMYHCHFDTVLHMERGMTGAIVVRPPDGSSTQVWANGPVFNREYLWQLNTFDSLYHALNSSTAGITSRYRPDYFLINGRDGGNLLTDSTVAVTATPGQIVLIRLVNFGYLPALVNLGGIPFDIIASDGRPLRQTLLQQTEVFISAGERYDVLFIMPAGGAPAPATVAYYNIMGTNVLGTASTTITSV